MSDVQVKNHNPNPCPIVSPQPQTDQSIRILKEILNGFYWD